MDPVRSIFVKAQGEKVVIRPDVQRSVATLFLYFESQAIEGAARAQMNPSYRDSDGNNRLQTYYENAAAFLAGARQQLEQKISSRALAMATLSLVGGDNSLGHDLLSSVTDTTEEASREPAKPLSRAGGERADGPAGKGNQSDDRAVPARRVRPGGSGPQGAHPDVIPIRPNALKGKGRAGGSGRRKGGVAPA